MFLSVRLVALLETTLVTKVIQSAQTLSLYFLQADKVKTPERNVCD